MKSSRFIKTAFAFLILSSFHTLLTANEDPPYKEIHVGVILDMGSRVGKVINRFVIKGISDFYTANPHCRTRIVVNTRDTKGKRLLALSAALDLVENNKVRAIIGPHSTTEARFLEILEEKANLPILSLSTSPFTNQNPNFLQIAQDETTQFKGIAALVESLYLNNIILICEDNANGREMATYIISSFRNHNKHVTYTSLISTSVNHTQILEEFHKFQYMQTKVFVVHGSPSISSRLFSMAKDVGMMSEGYTWIVTSKTTNFLKFMDSKAIESMQGAVGFKSYFPKSSKFHGLKHFMGLKEVDYDGMWAYDAVYALAMAVERLQTKKHVTKLALLDHILRTTFRGLGGEFKFVNERTLLRPIEVKNVIGKGDKRVGFSIVNGEFVKKMGKTNSSTNNGLEHIVFPGGHTSILNHRRLQVNGKKMRILVPVFGGFKNILQMVVDPKTNLSNVSGFCGDVFNVAFNVLNHKVDIEFVPYLFEEGRTFNDLIDKVYYKEFDAAVGDITITSNRSRYVDFTLPYSDMGVGTLVRNADKSIWIFLSPLNADLWFTSAGFFLFLGFVIWVIEHRTNEEFQGSTTQQIGTTLWFAFSTLVYAHREKLESNLSRFVVTVWVFVVLVLTSSYTATLSSLLTVQQIALKGGSVQFQGISPVKAAVYNNVKLNEDVLVELRSADDYAKALRNGRVGAIIDEILYIKSVLALYSRHEFSLVATSSTTNGFGFVFQKGSTLAKDISTQIAKLREDGTLKALEDKWLERQSSIMSNDFPAVSPNILNLYGLRGLFLISGVSMAFALLVSMVYLAREKCQGRSKMEMLRRVSKICPTPSTCTR
ncbi:putative periplasmic binding protein-like I [Helianthus annuus]|nr:putative periplasmic binding protein-like I [Helianthus annuus]KAJ0898751.1 putative periplasmic binding protein-like I [Helianthus annuus]